MYNFIKPLCRICILYVLIFIQFEVCAYSKTFIQKITTQELKELIDKQPDVTLVDVLPKIIFDAKHIPGSSNIPIGVLKKSDKLHFEKTAPVVFYCMGVL
jgi:Rhodanese-like domain